MIFKKELEIFVSEEYHMKQKKQKLQILKCRIPCTWELLHKVKELGLTVLTIVTKDHSFKIVSKSKYLIEHYINSVELEDVLLTVPVHIFRQTGTF